MTGFYEQRFCVTGGAGFLGRRIVAALHRRGASTVFVPRRKDYDLRTEPAIRRMLRDARPDVIIHAAAVVGGIGANQERPAEFFTDNALMGIQLLHRAWATGVKKVVVVGTVCAYPKWTRAPFHEDDLWNGYPEETNAAYGLAKKMLLVQAQAYRRQYGFNAIYLLPTNLYGEGDNFDPETSHVIPALIRKFSEAVQRGDDAVTVWGTGGATREFLHVEDCAEGIVRATECYDNDAPLNLGSGDEINMRALVDRIAALTGFTGRVEWDMSRPDGQPVRALDCQRAFDALGWKATISFEDGLRRLVAWYQEAQHGAIAV